MESLSPILLVLVVAGLFLIPVLADEDWNATLPVTWCWECDGDIEPDTGWCPVCKKVRPR